MYALVLVLLKRSANETEGQEQNDEARVCVRRVRHFHRDGGMLFSTAASFMSDHHTEGSHV
jgi:hypothetical protein